MLKRVQKLQEAGGQLNARGSRKLGSLGTSELSFWVGEAEFRKLEAKPHTMMARRFSSQPVCLACKAPSLKEARGQRLSEVQMLRV